MDGLERPDTEGREAVCFTAGVKGAFFGAGVIHAYLASDRKPPRVAAGISFGAVTAAAFQRACGELDRARKTKGAHVEAGRWAWFRRYLTELCEPFEPIWRAFPDPVDFFADTPPVEDRSCPDELKDAERKARQQYHLLVHGGRWLAGLRLRLSTVFEAVVAYVRLKERYKAPAWQYVKLRAYQLHIALTTLLYALRPRFVELVTPKHWFLRWRPLLGWPLWLVCAAASASIVWTVAWTLAYVWTRHAPGDLSLWPRQVLSAWPVYIYRVARVVSSGVLAIALLATLIPPLRRFLTHQVLRAAGRALEVERGLLHDYHLRRKLWDVFADESGKEPRLGTSPFPVVLVAAALQSIRRRSGAASNQIWAPTGWPLVDALRAALGLPWLYPPLQVDEPEDIGRWLGRSRDLPHVLQVVDGTAIRKNPLPALFSFLRREPTLAQELVGSPVPGHPARSAHTVKLIFSAPLDGQEGVSMERPNVVEAVFTSLELAARRDSRLEQIQTNVLSGLAKGVFFDPSTTQPVVPLFVAAIAPTTDLILGDPLAPRADQILAIVATGCRRTLQALYAEKIEEMSQGYSQVACGDLLQAVAPGRPPVGLPEVCVRCTRRFEAKVAGDRIWSHSMAPEIQTPALERAKALVSAFPSLGKAEPRMVFVASGGVFRGSFHAGVVGALHAAGIRPDMVVGSSVGAMMSACLAAVAVAQPAEAHRLVVDLADCFLRVDSRIALTRTVKNAAKQLGVRGRQVRLSPRNLRSMIRNGTRSDPGYAALGAPPALLDAISDLLVLPHRQTRKIAAEFVAAHFTHASRSLWSAVQRETLRRLDIENAVVGTSLMESVAKGLLGSGPDSKLDVRQPFRTEQRGVAFFATATSLNRREGVLLGWDVLQEGAFDAVQACLASGAFPALFSPRSECLVSPGVGRADHFYADGGMFDNLPFYRTADVLSMCWSASGRTLDRRELKRRLDTPDLFLAGALDAEPANSSEAFPNVLSAGRRAKQLRGNVKIDTFQLAANLAESRLSAIDKSWHEVEADRGYLEFVGRHVHATVLKIVPTDQDHLNPTFAFCRSAGMERGRVARSIADGCFQTLSGFASANGRRDMIGRSVTWFVKNKRVPNLSVRPSSAGTGEPGQCPYFTTNGLPLRCPFAKPSVDADATAVYRACRKDRRHHVVRAGDPLGPAVPPGGEVVREEKTTLVG